MINLCENVLKVSGPAADLEKFRAMAGTEASQFDFERFVPTPVEFKESKDDLFYWLWRNEEWGTELPPRDVTVNEGAGWLEYCFLTAWPPRRPVIKSASGKFPELMFTLEYSEQCNDFSGLYEARAGMVRKDWEGCYTPIVWHPTIDLDEFEKELTELESEDDDEKA